MTQVISPTRVIPPTQVSVPTWGALSILQLQHTHGWRWWIMLVYVLSTTPAPSSSPPSNLATTIALWMEMQGSDTLIVKPTPHMGHSANSGHYADSHRHAYLGGHCQFSSCSTHLDGDNRYCQCSRHKLAMVRLGSGSALLALNLNMNLMFRFSPTPNPNLITPNLRFRFDSGSNWNFISKTNVR